MIRPVLSTSKNGPEIYGLTKRGVAWIAMEQGMVFAAITLSVFALNHGNKARAALAQARENGILIACHEANAQHRRAQSQLTRLIPKSPKPLTQKQRAARAVQLDIFLEAVAPAYVGGSPKLPLATRERLGCAARVREFSKP